MLSLPPKAAEQSAHGRGRHLAHQRLVMRSQFADDILCREFPRHLAVASLAEERREQLLHRRQSLIAAVTALHLLLVSLREVTGHPLLHLPDQLRKELVVADAVDADLPLRLHHQEAARASGVGEQLQAIARPRNEAMRGRRLKFFL